MTLDKWRDVARATKICTSEQWDTSMNLRKKMLKIRKSIASSFSSGRGDDQGIFFSSSGHCLTCNSDVEFVARQPWLRDHYLCSKCGSIPRERALMHVIENYYPEWRDLVIHESSPCNRGASSRLSGECRQYIPSQYFPGIAAGTTVGDMRCENLEALTFHDQSVDLHVTQDVLEHVFDPAKVFKEIARTLKPGGAHIFTVPLVNKRNPSLRRASIESDGTISYLEPAVYHGNPISDQGSLVVTDWGFDIGNYIFESSGLYTQIIAIDDLSKGIRAEYNEVLVTMKPKSGLQN